MQQTEIFQTQQKKLDRNMPNVTAETKQKYSRYRSRN